MAMFLDETNNLLRFDVPNSEASIDAQHFGIKDRTVGQYYMSEQYEICNGFLENLEGEYYIDVALSLNNAKQIIAKLKDLNYKNAFKNNLVPQERALEVFEWALNNNGGFYKINPPTINDKQKYLKLDNEDTMVVNFKSLVIGDLCSVNFKKIGKNGFVIYVDKIDSFDQIIKDNKVLNWMR